VGIPHPPVILALLFLMMIMMTGVWQDWSDLLQAAYNQPQVRRQLCFLSGPNYCSMYLS